MACRLHFGTVILLDPGTVVVVFVAVVGFLVVIRFSKH